MAPDPPPRPSVGVELTAPQVGHQFKMVGQLGTTPLDSTAPRFLSLNLKRQREENLC
jgi:hypothetical protein